MFRRLLHALRLLIMRPKSIEVGGLYEARAGQFCYQVEKVAGGKVQYVVVDDRLQGSQSLENHHGETTLDDFATRVSCRIDVPASSPR